MKEKRQFQNRLISLALAILFVLLPTNSLMTTAQIFSGSYSNSDLSEDSTFVLSKSNVQIGDDYNPEMQYNDETQTFSAVRVTATKIDEMVLLTQKWLNQEYGNVSGFGSVTENGKTGWNVIYGLTRALQHELGITELADNFGPSTKTLYAKNPLHRQDGVTDRKFAILQGALWCKGYNPGYYLKEDPDTGKVSFEEIFNARVEEAVISLKTDAGFINPDGVVTPNVMKALLSMDSFKLLSAYYGGTYEVRSMQQKFNRTYEDYIGALIPCDGVYGRSTSKALVYALQAEEGMPVGTATGNFGAKTQELCPQIPYVRNSGAAKDYNGNYYTDAKLAEIIGLVQFGLFLNGFGDGIFDRRFNPVTQQAVLDFQAHYALPRTGKVNLDTWMSLFISSGNPKRSAIAADCATILNAAKAKTLYDNGYRYIGRYLTGTYGGGISKALTVTEAKTILRAGLRFFPIYQTSSNKVEYFTPEKGVSDAQSAIEAADNLGLPADTIIYFAVDFDAMDYQITGSVIPYFEKVYDEVSKSSYKVGVYGARNVCTRVSNAGYACSSFVGDMSTGFSGNLGFKIPDNWAFSQFANLEGSNALGTGDGRIEIDKNAFSGRDQGVSMLRSAKKAIYVLPGYLGSRLYTEDGNEYWADQDKLSSDITDYIMSFGWSDRKDILWLDKNGENSKVHPDISKDFYGTEMNPGEGGVYKLLVNTLKKQCKGYDVVFFPYNWLADLNDSANELQNHINGNGYESVVFVTHSTGGLLAARYIAKSVANKRKVEKAILIAAPLYGTYYALDPLESGKVDMVDEILAEQLENITDSKFVKWLAYKYTYKFVRKAVHNSPTTYQLLPSIEYLKLMPQMYEDEFKSGKAITALNDYYSILNRSPNLNSNLTDGNKRSHKAFRNNIGDIVSVLQSVDTTLIGSSKGFDTTSVVRYKTNLLGQSVIDDVAKSVEGDGVVLAASAFALSGDRKYRLKYKDFANEGSYNHMDLAMCRAPIQYVCDTINGKAYISPADTNSLQAETNDTDNGIADEIKIKYSGNSFLTVNIYDRENNNVAQISENKYFGFDSDTFSFTPLEVEDDNFSAIIYMPNYGYRVEFSCGNIAGASVDFKAEVSTLDKNGWRKTSVSDSAAQTLENGLLASYDGTNNPISAENISSSVGGTVNNHFTDWSLPSDINLDLNAAKKIDVSGDDAESVSSLLTWSSSADSVASVSSNGTVTALGYGKTTISATDGNKIESCEITVNLVPTSVKIQNIIMTVGERYVIAPEFIPANSTDTDVSYTYEEGTVIKIDEFGVIQALAPGTISVTAKTGNDITAAFTVTVTDADFTRKSGDTNGDGTVDIIDLIRVKKHIAGVMTLTGIDFDTADIDKNSILDSADLTRLRKILLGI